MDDIETLEIPWPIVRPLAVPISKAGVREVWDAFVVPHQESQTPPSVEMRCLMAILRAVHVGMEDVEDE